MKYGLACLFLLMLGGCVQSTLLKPNTSPDEPLAYARRYSNLSAENQKKEYAMVTQALSRNDSDLKTRMKGALIYGLPSSRFRDNERALSLLDDVMRDKQADADTQTLAALLKDYINDRQKLESTAAKATQKAAEEQKRAENLQQKLDDLKNIEKALTERNQAGKK